MRCYHDDAALHLPGAPLIAFAGDFRGRKRIRRATQIAWDYCQTELLNQQDCAILVNGDTVIVQGRIRLRLRDGSLSGLHYTQTFKVTGELIVDHRVEYDTLNFARLALIPLDDAPAETPALNPLRSSTTSR